MLLVENKRYMDGELSVVYTTKLIISQIYTDIHNTSNVVHLKPTRSSIESVVFISFYSKAESGFINLSLNSSKTS